MSGFQTPAMGDVDNFLSLFDARIARLENGGSQPAASRAVAFSGLAALLNQGATASMVISGDSTGVSATRWPRLFAALLGAQFPAATVQVRDFNFTTAKWDAAPVAVQAGGGGDRYVTFDGTTLSSLLSSPTTYNNITGDIDLRARLRPTAWNQAGGNQTILAKFGAAGSRVYRFQLTNAGKLYFDWTADGSTLQTAKVSSSAVPFANGTDGWVRVVFQVSSGGNNIATFYTSTDGATWTQLGGTQSAAGATSLFSSTQPVEIGARGNGQAELYAGRVYQVEVRSGADGPITCPVWPEKWYGSTSNDNIVPSGAPVIDVWNGSWSGASLGTNLIPNDAIMVPAINASLAIINDSKNEGPSDAAFWTNLDTLASYIESTNPAAGIAVTAQNPSISPVIQSTINAHQRRCAQMDSYCARRGFSVIPVYTAFQASPLGLAALTNADGIHPSDAAGSPLWAQTVATLFSAAAAYA